MSQSMEPTESAQPRETEFRRFLKAILDFGCPTLQALEDIKKLGWSNDDVDRHFKVQQLSAAQLSNPDDEAPWLKIMGDSMKEMDRKLRFVPPSGSLRFLDIGCAPGGYSQYVLDHNWRSAGVGITLPVEDGGHHFLIPERLTRRGRYTVHFADVTSYHLQAPSITADAAGGSAIASWSPTSRALPFAPASFDLIILDGHVLRTRPHVFGINRVLLLTQLYIGLQSIKDGGTIFIKLTKSANPLTARLLFLLDSVSGGRLDVVKPRTVHSNRGTFYAVARGIKRGQALDELQASLYQVLEAEKKCYEENKVITQSLAGGPDEVGPWDLLAESEGDVLDMIVPYARLVGTYIPRLVQLLEPVWTVQRDGLVTMLKKKGVHV